MPIIMIPPSPPQPLAQVEHEPPQQRINFRLQQIILTAITLGVTCWLWTIHPIVGIAATFLAKHVLVAILASGLTYPPVREERKQQQ
jgi:hypothetical protein